jgi:hypothetical protein
MKKEIITTDNYLLVVDDSKIKDYYYDFFVNKLKHSGGAKYAKSDIAKQVIAHLPINNSPILEGVDLLPPIEDEVDIAEKALFTFLDKYFNTKRNWKLVQGQDTYTDKEAIMMLYSDIIKSKEKYKYTEEDVLDAWELGASEGLPLTREKKNNLIKHLQQPKMHVAFEHENTIRPDTRDLRKEVPAQWVGKYIY